MDIFLRFFNLSSDVNSSDVVFFQNNASGDSEALSIAWKVIRRCGYGNYHPFVYSTDCHVSASDSYGNFTPHLPASPGQLFHAFRGPAGNQLGLKGRALNSAEVVLANDLERGAIGANIFKNDKLFARKTAIAPGQIATFSFKPSLMISAYSQITEGQGLDSCVMTGRQTELSLLGVISADIIMTGGGPDEKAEAFSFHLANIVRV